MRLLRVAIGLLCFGTASNALASVPMCGPDAQSIAAPPIVMPQRDARLAPERPCDKAKRLGVDPAPDPTAPERSAVPASPERWLPAGALLLVGPEPLRLPRAWGSPRGARLGVPSLVYRPPRDA